MDGVMDGVDGDDENVDLKSESHCQVWIETGDSVLTSS
jgi:hypothetical protein